MGASPTFSNYFVYFFNLGLYIGMVASAMVLIMAGYNYIFSRGEVSRLEKSKKEIIRALAGLAILFGSIVIVNTINSRANQGTQAIDNLEVTQYAGGIILKHTDPNIPDTHLIGDLSATYNAIGNIEWLSSAEELPRIFVFPEKDFQGAPIEVLNGSTAYIGIGRSISFDWAVPGVYLYDITNFQLKDRKAPLAVLTSQPALGNVNFKDKTASIKIIQPKKTGNEKVFEYRAVLFSEDNYTGQCAWVKQDLKDIKEINGEENKVRVGLSENFKGIQTVGSIYILKSDPDQQKYAAKLFNGTNCLSQESLWDKGKKEFLPNVCDVTEFEKELKFSEACQNMPQKPDTIVSAQINDGTVLILKDKNGNCQLFEKKGASNCITSITYGIFNMENRNNPPWSFIFLPGNSY